ncbi:acetyltransferase [Polynucleobacter sp. CS-Odin-A6]|uniref:acetyltransferase n=1 Tax=Polynucleobacter sp. CS-Odin-A6 TaxID=2689106 RepID=UPI001C20C8F5|nr:acetyltransferase [Polynucleobacter sp. CS-Odin-A6]
MKRSCLIIGARGYGREVLTYIEQDNPLFTVKGFLDDNQNALNDYPRDVKIIDSPHTYIPLEGEAFIAAIGNPRTRFEYTKRLRDEFHVDFATVVHPRANISQYANMGIGSIIAPHVGISVDVSIGEFTHVQEYTVIGHDAKIGKWCQINSHCTIAGGATIGNFVTIHPNCVVTSKAVIGDGVVVAPGSVVVGKIPPNITVLGNPARRFSFKA